MKSGPWLVAAGAVAGFLGVLGLHKSPSSAALSPARSQPSGRASTAAGGASPAASPGPAAGTGGTASATGTVEQYGYGELSARVTVSGGRITAVAVPVLKTAEQYSQQLAQQVIPTLRSEVLAAQSAHIQAVSGATYTSEAYATSVQAALDQVHVK